MQINEVSGHVVDAAMKVHTVLGPGLLESAYRVCLAHELRQRGLSVLTDAPLAISYDRIRIEAGYKLELLVNDLVLVELKAVSKVHPIHQAQLLSYWAVTRSAC